MSVSNYFSGLAFLVSFLLGFSSSGVATLPGPVGGFEDKNTIEFPLDMALELYLQNFPSDKQLVYRYHSFGNTRLKITAHPESLKRKRTAIRWVHISRFGHKVLKSVTPSETGAEDCITYKFNFKQAGNYLLIPPKNHRTWRVECESGCGRKEVSLSQYIRQLSPKERDYFAAKVAELLENYQLEGEDARSLSETFIDLVVHQRAEKLDRFPTLASLKNLNHIRPILKLRKEPKKQTLEELPTSWREVVESFHKIPAPIPVPVFDENPNLLYGHFVSESVPSLMVAQNRALAAVMTALSEQKGYSLEFPRQSLSPVTINNLSEFIEVLWETGHQIELRDERVFANFLSYAYGDTYIRWPVWFKTDARTNDQEPIVFPAPHAQYVWQITGPEVNARVNFFLGIAGVGFFPKFDEERPQWSGFKSQKQLVGETYSVRSSILKATQAAETYLRRVRQEAKLYASDYPADGYGFTGICNDSTAVIEAALGDAPSFYPLFRSPKLSKLSLIKDGLEDILNTLPNDSEPVDLGRGNSEDKNQLYRRMFGMVAYPWDPNFVWDEKFFKQVSKQ